MRIQIMINDFHIGINAHRLATVWWIVIRIRVPDRGSIFSTLIKFMAKYSSHCHCFVNSWQPGKVG